MLQKEAFYFDDLKDLSVADTFDKLSTSPGDIVRVRVKRAALSSIGR